MARADAQGAGDDAAKPLATRAVDRALALLAAVTDDPSGATLSELSRTTDLSPSTATRLLRTLVAHGLVARDEDGRYRPGTRLVQAAAVMLREDRLYVLAGRHLQAIVAQTGETANLGIATTDGRALYLRQESGTHMVRTANWTGRTIPLRGTAMGAALGGRVNDEGFAARRATIEPDVSAVAAPVFDRGGEIVGALSVLAPTYRTSEDDLDGYGRALVREAGELSAALGAPAAEAA